MLEAKRLLAECRVLIREHPRSLGAADDLPEGLSAGNGLDRARRSVHVERVEARLEPLLRGMEVALGDVQPELVLPQALLHKL